MKKIEKTTEERQKTTWFDVVSENDIDIIKRMVSEGNINYQDRYGWTALHFTCWCGNIDTAKLFIENGADVTARDKDGDTPLDRLKRNDSQKYKELIEWLTEEHPEKMLELVASENSPSKGVGL